MHAPTPQAASALMSKLAELTAKAAARGRERAQGIDNDETQRQEAVKLPPWPEATRGVPNPVLRSALFGAIKKGPRRYLEREQIAALEGINMYYTGQRLDQGDLDLWMNVLHVARCQAMGEQCQFTAYAMLKLLGKTDTGSNRATLYKRLMRLKANALEVQLGRYSYAGSLIADVYRDTETHEYVLVLNPKLQPLFARDQFTQVDWDVRHALNGKPLAQWLHGYYASHAKQYPISIATIHRLCGSESLLLSDFKKDLKKALCAVQEAGEAHDQPFSSDIKGHLVYVEKMGSGSQRRHVANKSTSSRRRAP